MRGGGGGAAGVVESDVENRLVGGEIGETERGEAGAGGEFAQEAFAPGGGGRGRLEAEDVGVDGVDEGGAQETGVGEVVALAGEAELEGEGVGVVGASGGRVGGREFV